MSDLGTVGKYTLRRVLGKGAMGVVYEAFDPMIERTVALKTIRKDLWEDEDGAELRERFLREARAAGRLLHPGIVTVYEFGEADGGAFIVMEHVSGRTLKEMMDEGRRFSVAEAVELMVPVLSALGYSHRAGVVHRDIKPANLMVTDDGQVKILDFGVARLASANITQVGTILGTPAYMAPEQLMGQTVDSRADLYSAGVILRELLSGRKTFTGDYGQVLHQVLHGDLPPPSSINPAVSAGFDAIVAHAMAKDPEQRFGSAEEFITALRQPTTGHRPVVTQPAARPDRSIGLPIAVALAAVVAVGGGVAAYQMGLLGGAVPPKVVAEAGPAPVVVAEVAKPATRVVELASPPPAKSEPAAEAPKPAAEPPKPEPSKPEPPKPEPPKPEPVAEAPKPEPVEETAKPEPVKPEPVAEAAKPEPVAAPEPAKPALTEAEVVALLSKPVAEPPAPAKPKPPTLTVVTDRGSAPRYKVGDTMTLTVSIERQAEVFCFYQSAAGEIMRVFPNRFSPDATVKAKQALRLPGNQPFAFKFDRKNSREEVRCLGLDTSMAARLPKLLGGSGFETLPYATMNALIDTIRRTAGDEVAVGGVVVTVE
jgi:serine/threonine-protein kinase